MSKQYGKGSNRRQENTRKVRDNWDGIKGFRKLKRELREREQCEQEDSEEAKN